jgi:hypothetical protein
LIRGEYWIQDGQVDFADGDTGDKNHEMIAIEHVCSEHLEAIHNYAKELGISANSLSSLQDEPTESAQWLLELILKNLFTKADPSNPKMPLYKSDVEIWNEIEKNCGMDKEALHVIMSGNYSLHRHSRPQSNIDPRLYVMKKEGWIAVRNDNIELFGFDETKRRNLVGGLEDILDQEGVEDSDEEIEFNLYDHKTGRSSEVRLADLKGSGGFRPQQLPSTTYNKPILIPTDKSRLQPKAVDARTRSLVQTSEGLDFKSWLKEEMIRRAWPETIATGEGQPDRLSSRKGRQRNRRSQ